MQNMVSRAVGRGTGMLAERVAHYSEVAGAVGEAFRDRGEPQAAMLANAVASKADQMAGYLRTHDGAALVDDARSFAKQHTWIVAGAGLLGGLLISRVVLRGGAPDEQWPLEEEFRQ